MAIQTQTGTSIDGPARENTESATAELPRPDQVGRKKHFVSRDTVEKLLFMVLEKLILAVIIAAATFWFSLNLEQFKARAARENAVAERALKILDALSQPLSALLQQIDAVAETSGEHEKLEATSSLTNKSSEVLTLLNDVQASTWLPRRVSKELKDRISAINNKSVQTITHHDVEELQSEVERLKLDIIRDPLDLNR